MKIIKLFFPLIIIAAIFQRCQENDLLETYVLDSEQSLLEWKDLANYLPHSGILQVAASDIKVKHGRIISGTITMPISSISHIDQTHKFYPVKIEQANGEQMLKEHPAIVFKIREVTLLSGIHPTAVQGANWWIRGDLTMWGQTHQISFPAKIKYQGNDMEVEAKFTLDRTIWGMDFGNDLSFGNQTHPIVDLHLKGKGRINNRVII